MIVVDKVAVLVVVMQPALVPLVYSMVLVGVMVVAAVAYLVICWVAFSVQIVILIPILIHHHHQLIIHHITAAPVATIHIMVEAITHIIHRTQTTHNMAVIPIDLNRNSKGEIEATAN